MTLGTDYHSPAREYAGKAFSAEELELVAANDITIGDDRFASNELPIGFEHREDLGILVAAGMHAQRLQGWPAPYCFAEAPRAVTATNGDIVVGFVAGTAHQFGCDHKANDIYLCRSSDRAKTWTPPALAWDEMPYNQHAFNPLRPEGDDRIYHFQEESTLEHTRESAHSGPLCMRYSDDHGHSWSDLVPIRPENDPGWEGVCHMQMCETDSRAWLLGTYSVKVIHWGDGNRRRQDTQYVLRTENRGESWTLFPAPSPSGWRIEQYDRMLEGLTIHFGQSRIVMFTRVPSGHIWELRSEDDGLTWTQPKETELVHPDAPPMIYRLRNGNLLGFIHNRPPSDPNWNAGFDDRRELWVVRSDDEGHTWSEPRLFTVDACEKGGWKKQWVEVGYADLLETDDARLHLFFNHQKRQILQISFSIEEIDNLPIRSELKR